MLKKEFGLHAPLWKRTFAYLIDAILIDIIIVTPFRSILRIKIQTLDEFYKFLTTNTSVLIISFFTITLLTLFYWTILEYKLEQSIGKMLLKIKVISKTRELSLWQCIVRNLTKTSLLFLLLDCLYLLNKKHQRYFEKLSQTRVIEKKI